MTVITYLNAHGKRLEESPSLESPGNALETWPGILEPHTTLQHPQQANRCLEPKEGLDWIRTKEEKRASNKESGKRQTWGRGVKPTRTERGGKTERYEQRIQAKHQCEVWEEPKSVMNRGMQGDIDGGCRLGRGFPFTLSLSGGKYQSKRRKKGLWSYLWPFDERKDGVGRWNDVLVRRMRLWDVVLRLFLVLSMCPNPASSQGNFPRLENIAAFKPISTSPARSTCGFPVRSSYCRPASTQADLLGCSLNFCIQDCPYRSSTPPHAPLLLPTHRGSCVTEDSDTHPEMNSSSTSSEGVLTGTSSVVFQSVPGGCLVSPPSQNLGPLGSLTLAVWIKPAASGEMVLLEKSSGVRLVFVLMVSERAVTLQYGQQPGHHTPLNISFITEGRIAVDRWTHLVLQVHDKQASLFLDGLEEDGTPFDTRPLTSRLTDITDDSTMLVGQGTNGSNQFIGRMQDFRLYPDTLTNREVVEAYSGVLPSLHTQSECRCPPSHPRVHPLVERYCIPNAVQDTTNNRVLRLDLNAHPLSYINDQDMGTIWLSKPAMDEPLTVTVDLANGQYQVFYVIVQFGGLLPESVRIQRRSVSTTEAQNGSRSDAAVWSDWQYMARDCSVFGLENDGPLLRPDSVNCLQLPREVPYTGGNITFSLLTPEPNLRPGYNDFYSTPALQRMVQATHIRIHLSGQYHTTAAGVNRLHRYYAINEITVSGRCECHGHADDCDITVTPYRCACVPESHTEGHNCQRCAPLYNDKPFRSGDQLQPMNCRPCQCNGHAHSCHYDVTADDQPDEHYRGGGGVCDNCMHNTTGKSCELCSRQFFRLEGSEPWSVDVCQPCDCHTPGTVNGRMQCDQVGGQCSCKSGVAGRRCAECLPGWFGLQAGSPEGCVRCNCTAAGAAGGLQEPRCDQETGQCHCKAHVTGLSCERCEFGFWNLSHPAGCLSCSCDPVGSLSAFCEVATGQCECKDGVGGRACDSCSADSYGLRLHGGSCRPCNCSSQGTVPGTHCDPHTGQCVCKEHVEGGRCDSCRAGYHSLEGRNSLGCLPCACDVRGTVPGSVCDAGSSQCACQEGLEGAQCNRCAPNYYNGSSRLAENTTSSHVCIPCSCDPGGSVEGTVCDSDTGQCVCVATRHRPDCSSCRPGFYLSEDSSVCVECGCHPIGATQRVCDERTGQCACADLSVAGRRCDQCRDSYHGFNPGHGRCQPCRCHPVGSVHGSCHPDSGVCACKALVTGDQCDACAPGASHMDPDNHLGCSRAPSQQPVPVGVVLSSSSIRLSWGPPDSPNSHSLNYTLIRDGQPVYTVHSQIPFLPQSFEDTGLSPFTNYSYRLLTANIAGQTTSSSVSYQTLSAAPAADQLHLSLVGRPGPTGASFNWSSPRNDTGPVERFVLSSIESSSREPVVHYTGVSTDAVASGLKPFSLYMFTLEVCSTGGCSVAPPLSIFTAPTAPQDQPPPRLNATGPHTLQAEWEPPSQPNGVITRYEVYLRGPVEPQDHSSPVPERRVFVSSGWLDPSVTPESNVTGIAPPPENSTTITGLRAFSTYHVRVVSANVAGSVTSEWTAARTLEGAPEWISPPDVSAVSPSILKVTWNTTEGHGVISRGKVTEYRVNILTEQTSNPFAPPVVSQVLYSTSSSSPPGYEVRGLKPHSVYNFTVTACTTTGCITSTPSTGRTLPGVPSGLSPPILHPFNDTTMQIYWDPPTHPNGPPLLYQVERTDLSFSDPRDPVVRGTRFPGSAYYRFPNDTLPVNTDFTGVQLSFRTRSSDGLLLVAFSPGNQEEFVALQIQNGRPYFLFDPQDSVVAVGVQGDAGRRYDDGQWHSFLALRHGAVGTIVVDDQYRGQASASSGRSIIGENTGVYVGGVPDHFTLLRPDAADVGLVLRGFAGCLRDVRYKMVDNPSEEWRLLDWSTATERVGAYDSWEGCPAQSSGGVHFLGQGYLELNSDVLKGGENFEVTMEFRTDQLNTLMLFTYNTLSDDYILVELEGGLLYVILFWGGHMTDLIMWAGLSYCHGEWSQLSVGKQGSYISATVNDWSERMKGKGGEGSVAFDSPVYLGGIPPDLVHPALIGRHRHGLGGCVRALTISSDEGRPAVSVSVDLPAASRRALRVNLDGCSASESRFYCRGNDSVLVYTGRQKKTRDYTLQPFTEYLYRVVASGIGGWAAGPWERGRSPATVPSSVPTPSVVPSGSGFSVQVSWAPPNGDIRGVIDRYELRAYDTNGGTAPVKATYLNSGNYTGVLSGLTPNTHYTVTVSACTPVGCVESHRHGLGSWSFITQEEAPQGVFVPEAVSSPSSLDVTWRPPARPNGVITEYHLYHNHRLLYRGNLTHLNITGLDVYSTHVLVLGVCTSVGCTNSSQVTMVTSQLPPSELQPPSITLLDPHSILVEWSRPHQVNGVLQSYSLFLTRDGAEPVLAYNSSSLVEDHALRNLTPGTAYTVTLVACTGGGCTLSLPSHFRTVESSPEDVPAPYVTALSPHSLNVSWTPPDTPNGVITSYSLWLDGALVLNSSSSQRFFVVEGLSPWSQHTLRLQACTAQGCGKGPLVESRTSEWSPDGPVLLEVSTQSSQSVRVRWTAPPRPNGNLSYTIYYTSTEGEGVLRGGSLAGTWVHVSELSPYTNYTVWVRGCNSQGCVESLPRVVTTLPAAPAGVSPPRLAGSTGTSLNVSWSPPNRTNSPDPLHYSLSMKPERNHTSETSPVIILMENVTDRYWYSVEGLSPFSVYLFRLVVSHTHGRTASPWISLRTAEDTPRSVDAPSVSELNARNVTVTWAPPSQPNGLIDHYNLHLHSMASSTTTTTSPDTTSTRLQLSPRTVITPPGSSPPVSISGVDLTSTTAVTSSGPSRGSDPSVDLHQVSHRPPSSDLTTPGSAPPLSSAGPHAADLTPNPGTNSSPHPAETSASVSRTSQGTSPISFRTTGSNTISSTILLGPTPESDRSPPTPSVASVTVTVSGNTTSYTFINLLPFHTYTLQVEACTRAGCSMSESHQTFRTPPAPPEGVPPPHLYSDTPTSVLLSWGAPERSNGPLEGWWIERRMPGTVDVFTVGRLSPSPPPLSFLDSSSALSPWSTYQYRLLASTQAGSTAGPWVSVTTKPSRPAGLSPPRVTVLGSDSIQVTWSPPLIANGEIQGYEVRLPEPRVSLSASGGVEDQLGVNVTDQLGVNVTGLVPFTTYNVTVLVCSHGAGGQVGGCTESLPTVVTTLPSVPRGLEPLAVVAVSESLLAVSWEPPRRPNGPNIRYELLRRKSQQPLASATTTATTIPTATAAPPRGPHLSPPPPPPPPAGPHSEDLHRWVRVYSGTKLFYQDKGLSRFTWYQYQLLVHNDVGYSAGEIVTMATMAGVPLRPPSLSVLPVNHTAVQVNWTQPSLQDLQGDVERYFLFLDSDHVTRTLTFPPGVVSTVIGDLWPSSTYHVSLWVSNGAHNTTNSTLAVTTNDGEPQGVSVPEVVVVNSTTVRVLWSPPGRPNGAITSYSLYLNERLHGSTDNTSGSYLLGGLLPYTVYRVQVEVCTVYTCVKSNATQLTTEEDLPADLAVPHTLVLSSRAVSLNWSSPGRPSGIMLGYEVLRRSLRTCGGRDPARARSLAVAEAEGSGGGGRGGGGGEQGGGEPTCSYLECQVSHGVCGTSCFPPDTQVCCDGVLYNRSFHHQCCEGRYLPSDNSSHTVCCGGKLLPPLPDHQCCAGYYIPVESGEHCCPDSSSQGHVSSPGGHVGPGDSCCRGVPFSRGGGQLCCAGVLHDGYRAQCCDGRLVDHTLVCCGDAERGTVHTHTPGLVCCGLEYINSSTSLCCLDHDGYPSMHPAGNATVTLQCCGSKVIHQEEECCNGIGYDPRRHVCADRPTPGLSTPPQCLQAALCPVSSVSTAFCGSCDVDPSQSACTWVLITDARANTSTSTSPPPPAATAMHGGARQTAIITHSPHWSEGGVCASPEEVVYSGDANTYTYTDSGLEPFTSYEYRVRGWNRFGEASSDVSTVTTHEDKPWGVSPPRWSGLGDRDDIIQLQWQAPARPNGIITHYVVLRDGQERYRGNEYRFTDVGGIGPFQEFTYQLRACNQAGCADSAQVVAATVQGVPEGVRSPMVTALSPSSLLVTWPEPISSNGIVQQYVLTETGTGTNYTLNAGTTNHTVTGLKPYTDYSFVLVACSAMGCGTSHSSTGRTLQDTPAGVWARPRHLVLNSSAVELFWDQPDEPNGPPSQTRYRLIRDGRSVFTGQRFNYTDTDLDAGRRYVYELEASTGGGSSVSGRHVVQTPASSPTGIAPPYNVTVSGARSLFIAWTPPAQFNSSQPLQYNVLLNPGSESSVKRAAGQNVHLAVTGLEPFTTYHVRVQACQDEGCGVGEGLYMQTLEAVPEGLSPPTVTASGARVLEVHWTPPRKANGRITSYFIHRRPVSTEEELLVFIWSDGPLEFVDASHALRPYSQYEYRVVAQNSKGSVYSQWASAVTLEAEPEDMAPPIVTPTSAYSVHLRWTAPFHPNGLISQYRLVYKKHQQDPTLNSSAVTALTVEGSMLEANISGLQPYTEYSLRVEAVNAAGSVSSPWVVTRTLESSPAGLVNFTVEQMEQGRALLLTWDQPRTPNGLITVYNVYSEGNLEFSGLSRQFLFRRLEPWSVYSLLLEACTSAGCMRTPPQLASTAAAPPAAQPPPTPLSIGPDRVSLAWGPPSQPNGPIGEYSLLGRSLEEVGRGRSNENDLDRGKVLFRESSPEEDADRFSYTVTGLRPWTQYQFSVRVHNPAGHALSPWVTVTTKQAPPRGLAAPTVAHLQGRPGELLVSWTPPLETNGVLLSYRIQRDNVSFSFSFDASVLGYTDEDLLPFTEYRYAVIACTSEGCVTSPETNITTLEAPPVTVDPPSLNIAAHSIKASWSVPLTENGEVTEYVLRLNEEEVYRGRDLSVTLAELLPHTQYELVLLACNSGGCTPSATASTVTDEAPPTGLMAPTLKVTGPESVEVSWTRPEKPNGVITGYELRRDGALVYVGTESHYHDFLLAPNVEYSYAVRANNSRGAVDSPASTAKTNPSAPSGVTPPTLQAVAPDQVRVEWSAPARPNGDIVSYTVYQRDPVQLTTTSTVYTPQHSAFSGQHATLQGLAPYHRYEVRVEACTDLGCSSSDWSSVLTLESPPAGLTVPLLDLQADSQSGLQTTFLLSWSPPARPNGRVLHYEVYRRLDRTTDTRGEVPVPVLVCRNDSTSCRDEGLQPYTAYQYQVMAVNVAGHSASPWVSGRTGPAPPEGIDPPSFLRILATSAVVEIPPPARPNGIVSLYRVFSVHGNAHSVLSEGTSREQTIHGLSPFTKYWVGVEACTCYQCCNQGPTREFRTLAAPPSKQHPPRPLTLSSRSVLLEWDEPQEPNGVIESCELHVRPTCPQPLQPISLPCTEGRIETRFIGKHGSYNVTGLRPYSSYELRVACFNNMGSTVSNWTSVTTLTEAPQYVSPFSVDSNVTMVWLDWSQSFSLNGPLKEFSVTENRLRIYSGFHSHLHIPRTSQRTLSFQVTCTTDSGSATTPTIRYNPATGLGPVGPTEGVTGGVSMSSGPVYSELWFILLLALLGLFLLAILLGVILHRALRKSHSSRERPPLVTLHKTRHTGGEMYTRPCPEYCSRHHSTSMMSSRYSTSTGFSDTKIVGGGSRFSPMTILRVPSQSDVSRAYSQHALHRSVSQLIDRKSLMDEGSWDNPLGQDSGLYVEEEDEFNDAIKHFSNVKKEHTYFIDTQL